MTETILNCFHWNVDGENSLECICSKGPFTISYRLTGRIPLNSVVLLRAHLLRIHMNGIMVKGLGLEDEMKTEILDIIMMEEVLGMIKTSKNMVITREVQLSLRQAMIDIGMIDLEVGDLKTTSFWVGNLSWRAGRRVIKRNWVLPVHLWCVLFEIF